MLPVLYWNTPSSEFIAKTSTVVIVPPNRKKFSATTGRGISGSAVSF
jgi:hypothetical protein